MSKFVRIYLGMFDGDQCPICHSCNTVYSNHFKDWHCCSCGHDWD